MTAYASDKSEGPYAEHAPFHDAGRVDPDDYVREPDPTPGELAALDRAVRESRARMTPEERARWDAAIADPWAVTR